MFFCSNDTGQFVYRSEDNLKSIDATFTVEGIPRLGVLSNVTGPVVITGAADMSPHGARFIGGTSGPGTSVRYLPLEFQINGRTTCGNAFFTAAHGLDRVEYASAVPEPAMWMELLAGFAFAGAAVRRRSQAATAA